MKGGASDEILSCLLQFNIFLCLIFFPLFSSQLALVCLCPFIPLRFSMFWRKECRVCASVCVCLPERVCMCVCLSVRVCWSRFELLRAISRDRSQSRMAVVGHPVPIQPSGLDPLSMACSHVVGTPKRVKTARSRLVVCYLRRCR